MAFTYRVEDNFRSGIPQTVFQYGAGPFRGISCHWTAGAPGRYGALGTVQFLIDNASRNASYHEIWWWENKTFGVMRIVRPERASHSMNPTPPTWSPNTIVSRSEEHTSELQSPCNLVCRLLLEKKNDKPLDQTDIRDKN